MTQALDRKSISRRAEEAFADADYSTVLSTVNDGLIVDPEHPPFLRLKLRALIGLNRLDAALDAIDGMPVPLRRGALIDIAVRVWIQAGRPQRARAALAAPPHDGSDTMARQLAMIRLVEHDDGVDAALECARELAEAWPDRQPLRREYERLSAMTERTEGIEARLRVQLEAKDPKPEAIRDLANLLNDTERPDEAMTLLQRHAKLDRTCAWWHLAFLRALEDTRQDDRLLAAVRTAAAIFPHEIRIQERFWRILTANRETDAATTTCKAFAARMRDNLQVQIAAAEFLIGTGDRAVADEILDDLDARLPGSPQILAAQARLRLLQHDGLSALALAKRAVEGKSPPTQAVRVMARAERAIGDLKGAALRLERFLRNAPNDAGARLEAAECYGDRGQFREALEHLDAVPLQRQAIQPRHFAVRSKIALSQGHLDQALDAARAAVQSNPRFLPAWVLKTVAELLQGDVAAAWASQTEHASQRYAQDLTGQASLKPTHSVLGQIINEFRLLDTDLSACAIGAPQHAAAQFFKERVDQLPDSTALAICQLSALQRMGELTDTPPPPDARARGNRIPRVIVQYWDAAQRPEQVDWVMHENQRLNPRYEHRIYNKETARTFIAEAGELDALRAFRYARHPAEQADIFRLVYLWHCGGVYLDADDRCLGSLSRMINHRLEFIGLQEIYRSIGNNFIAVAPQNPIIRSALEQAAGAALGPLGETLWLSSGPGALTRAFAQFGTVEDGRLRPGHWILQDHDLRRFVAPHTRLSYKSSSNHWVRSFLRQRDGI